MCIFQALEVGEVNDVIFKLADFSNASYIEEGSHDAICKDWHTLGLTMCLLVVCLFGSCLNRLLTCL